MPRVSKKKDDVIAVKKTTKKIAKKIKITADDLKNNDFTIGPKRKISLSELKPVIKRKRSTKKKDLETEPVVVLPEKIDSRLLEKVKFYEDLVFSYAPRVMRVAANVGGYVFIITGIYLCFLITGIKEGEKNDLFALTTCSTIDCVSTIEPLPATENTLSTTSTVQATSETTLLKPKVLFPSDFPAEPVDNFSIKVEVSDAVDVRIFLTSDSISGAIDLISSEPNIYQVPVDKLKPGIYTLRAGVLALDNITKYHFSGGKFTIKNPEIVTVSDNATTTPIIVTENNDVSTKTEEVINETITEKPPLTTEPIKPSVFTPILEVHKVTGENNYRFIVRNISNSRFVEVYAQPKLSNNPRFLGLAFKRDNVWIFNLNGSNLPVGNYEVFIKAAVDGQVFKSGIALFSITKLVTTEDIKTNIVDESADPIILSEKIKRVFEEQTTSTTTNNISLLEKRIAYFEKSDEERQEVNVAVGTSTHRDNNEPIRKEAIELLNKDKDKLNRLLKRYASTLQGEDQNLNRRAKAEIVKFRDSLVTESAINTKTKDISAQISAELDKEIERLQNKVEKYESLIKQRSELVAKDTDNDGITDFDEVNLYKTDTRNPDTDGDGVLDGVEIVSGYNPTNADVEAIISFHSPKDVNYVDEERMKIESVNPVIETDSEQGGVPLLTEIKGKGLPNSFVTLFVYSSPTVVSVKTDDNGDFVYTFTKELEDGDHEVYVAITDNKGEIVARSNPFQFVKRAEAFTPVDVKNSEVINYNQSFEDTSLSSYNIVAAMGIVSFGLILLMLGYTLRNRPEEIASTEASTEFTKK